MTPIVAPPANGVAARAIEALETFVDPCSEGLGTPLSVVALGLIESVEVDSAAGVVRVDFCPTGPSCFFQIPMMTEMERLVGDATGLRCEVTISDEVWTPDRRRADALPPSAVRPLGMPRMRPGS